MIEGLDKLLEGTRQPALPELRRCLADMLGGADAVGQVIEQTALKAPDGRVHRVRIEQNRATHSWIVKRLEPAIGKRNELVAKRWLPALGLGDRGARLLGVAGEKNGRCVWHIYEDLGDGPLEAVKTDWSRVELAVELIAEVHQRFARHPLLSECRRHGGDRGIHYFLSSLRDAAYSLEALCRAEHTLEAIHAARCKRLLAWVNRLLREKDMRASVFEEFGGPETLLHGDLWTTNTFVVPTSHGLAARLIDWDQCAVGPASYDLSTFLLRFDRQVRPRIVKIYAQAVAKSEWILPATRNLNVLFDTAECARTASSLSWPALALVQDRAPWALDMLAEIERWTTQMRPVLDEDSEPEFATTTAR